MAHNLVLEDAAVNAGCNAECALANDGYLRIKTSGGTLLAELRYAATAFGDASAGVATANAITPDTDANATGAAAKYESYKSDGTTLLWTGTAGATGGGFDLELNTVDIQIHAQVSVTSHTHTVPKS